MNDFLKKSIRDYVKKICDSSEFKTKEKLCRFLQFVVEKTLEGKDNELKGYTIGLEVFERKADFDPIEDSLVRINAGRLRRLLKIYYFEEGKSDTIQIDIPKGSYKPQFITRSVGETEEPKEAKNESTDASVIIFPFINATGKPDKEFMAHGFSEEISMELSKYDVLKVISCLYRPSEEPSDYSVFRASFIIDGSIYQHDQQIIIFVKLIDARSKHQLWGERYKADISVKNFIEIEEDIAEEVANIVGSETGIILKQLSNDFLRKKPQNLDVLNASLCYYYWEANQSRELMLQTFRVMSEVAAKNPDSGVIHAFLGNIYGNMYALDYPDNEGALENFIRLAEKAVNLDPHNPMVRIIYAYKCFLNNEKERFFTEAERCLSMNIHTPIRLGAIGFHLSLYGAWERGKKLLDTVMNKKIGYFRFFHGATTLYYYRNNEYKKALDEAMQYEMPNLFWASMLQAACLAQLNHKKQAQQQIDRLKKLKPDFEEKARYLISRFVKENELVEHVIDGLRKAGMKIEISPIAS